MEEHLNHFIASLKADISVYDKDSQSLSTRKLVALNDYVTPLTSRMMKRAPQFTLLSSITVLRDSIHMGSMSPSRTIHFGLSVLKLARSRMMTEKRPVGTKHHLGVIDGILNLPVYL